MTIRRNLLLLLRCTNEIPFALRYRIATYQRKRVTIGTGLGLTSSGYGASRSVLLHCCFVAGYTLGISSLGRPPPQLLYLFCLSERISGKDCVVIC